MMRPFPCGLGFSALFFAILKGRKLSLLLAEMARTAGFCCWKRLMKKLRRKGRVLFFKVKPPPFHCQYDPLSYALNFDNCDLDDDAHLIFSLRFVSPAEGTLPSLFKGE